MSVIATALKHLIAAGVSGDDLVRAVAEMEAATPTFVDEAADRRREKDRLYQAERRHNRKSRQKSADSADDATPPNEYISNPPEPSEAKASPSPFADQIVSEWNAGPAANGARKATRLDNSRKTLLKARLRDYSETEILSAMANLAANKFHCGENDRGWRVNLGWFLKAENFLKSVEMDDGAKPASTGQFNTPEARAAFLADLADKPWAKADPPPEEPRTPGNGRAKPIGDLIAGIGAHH